MDRYTYTPSRREFIAGTAAMGAAGLGIQSAAGKTWATHPETTEASGTVEVVVRFEPAAGAGKATLQQHARRTQRPFEQFAAEQPAISIERQFWAANAALVSVDIESVSRNTILGVDNVTTVHANYAVGVDSMGDEPETVATATSRSQTEEPGVTYPLEEMNVPQAWEVHETRGEGVDVAVIDTGIDTSEHEELAASLERGGWAEFDEDGNRVDSDPNAQTNFPSAGHGTSVSGVIAGGTTDDGDVYGVAPEVNLYMVKQVSQPPEGIRTLSVFAGIEWAIEQDVDILTMSLGLPQYNQAFVEPIQNAIESGILVVNSIGNSGRYTSVSAGNIPGVLSVGGIDDDRELYEKTGGERIDTERYWGDSASDSWPQEYTVPDVTAPGVNVVGPVLDGQFERNSGTSFAAPLVAGVAALAIAATDADNDAIRNALTETARHPAADAEFDVDPGHDDRYGQGIVSALAAISQLRASETLSGRVTDASGSPLDSVTVASEAGMTTLTDAQGRYELTVPPGTQPIGATGIGFDPTGERIDPAEIDTREFQLDRTSDLDVQMADRMSTRIDTGEEATARFDVANAETVAVEIETDGLFDAEALELSVDGTAAAFGESVSIDQNRTQISVGVTVPESVLIGQFQLSYEFTGDGESATGEGHRVYAHSDPFVISPVDPPTLQAPIDLVAPRTTIELLDGQGNAVAQADDQAGLVIDKPLTLTAADGATPTIQFSNEGAEEPAVVMVTANDVTISGLVVDGSDAETGIQVARQRAVPKALPHPSGVTVRDLEVKGADTAVRAGQAPALEIVNNELTAKTTGISVGREVAFRDSVTVTGRTKTTVRENSVTDVETGIDVAGQVAAIDGNSLSNIETVGIHLGTPRFLSRHWGVDIGPVRSNTITNANRGIVISGVMTLPVEENSLSDIAETAFVVDGAVLAPIRANSVDGAERALDIADDASAPTITGNEFSNIRNPAENRGSNDSEGTQTEDEEEDTDSNSDDSGPGFGIGSALVGLGSASYLLKRRFSDDETESE